MSVSPITRFMRAVTYFSASPCSQGFQAFLASSAYLASATSYHSCSAAPLPWPSAFAWVVPVFKSGAPFWPSGLTLRSSGLAFSQPLTLAVRATTPMFTFKTAMLFWLVAASVPLLTSLVYFRASPSTESLIQRIAVSLHGVAISALCVGAVLVGMLGAPRPELGDIFRFLLFVPITLVIYSFWRFQGKRSIHLLQGINLLWLALAFFFGGMAVTGVWL